MIYKYTDSTKRLVYVIDDDGICRQSMLSSELPENTTILDYEETLQQTIARLESAIDEYINEQAKSLRYESIKTIITYRDDPNPKFKAEGIAGYQLRSAVYTSSIQLIEDVLNGIKEVPSEEELLASLPKITDYLVYE